VFVRHHAVATERSQIKSTKWKGAAIAQEGIRHIQKCRQTLRTQTVQESGQARRFHSEKVSQSR
jgi:hypothetical protein